MRKYLEVTIPRRHPAVLVSCLFMAASAIIRLCYYLPQTMTAPFFWIHLVTPVSAAGIFITGILLGGKYAKSAALISLALGGTFFILKAMSFAPIHKTLCIILYLTVLVLFSATLLGLLPTKKLLYPLFGCPLAYHILVNNIHAYFFTAEAAPPDGWMPEISVLCIMASLLSLSAALEVKRPDA